jgi:hypothetical protein
MAILKNYFWARKFQIRGQGVPMKFFLAMVMLMGIMGCASSRDYKPLPWEAPLYETHKKTPFPNEVTAGNIGNPIHWLGIIDTFWVEGDSARSILNIEAEHKYWDYIEDFSVQREKMFVSPFGAGKFIYRKKLENQPIDTTMKHMSVLAEKKNIGMFYGKLEEVKDGIPILDGDRARFIHRQFYSTRIWEYKMVKDSAGNYEMADFKTLMLPKAGINDPEDKTFE